MWQNDFVRLLGSNDATDIERAYRLKEAHFPPSVFKYRGATDLALQNLRDGTVWLSSAARFNDPYDSALSVDLHDEWSATFRRNLREQPPPELEPEEFASVLEAVDPFSELLIALSRKGRLTQKEFDDLARQQAENAVRLTEDFSARLSGIHQDALKACAFSAVSTSLVMWAHYADCHRGFCIEYATSALGDARRQRLFPVIYGSVRLSLTEQFNRFTASGNMADPRSQAAQLLPALAAIHKAEEWSYEHEWRFLCIEPNVREGLASPKPKPKALCLGSRMDGSYKIRILELAKSAGIPCYEAALVGTTFALEPRPIRMQ